MSTTPDADADAGADGTDTAGVDGSLGITIDPADLPFDPSEYAGGLSPVDPHYDDTNKEREKRCSVCRARVTVGTDGTTEYGHQYGCEQRPEGLRRHGPRTDTSDPDASGTDHDTTPGAE